MARPRLVTDEQIIETLRAAVLAYGPSVSLEVVAQNVGVSLPALLKRFGSRQALMLVALVPRGTPDWVHVVEQGPDGRPLREQLRGIAEAAGAWFQRIYPFVSALRESGIPHEEVVRAMLPAPPPVIALEALERWLERARERGLVDRAGVELGHAAAALVGAVQHRIFICHLLKRDAAPEVHRDYADLSSASLDESRFIDTNCTRTRFEEASLRQLDTDAGTVTFEHASLIGADLSGANLREIRMSGADLTRARLVGALLIRTQLTRACLRDADLTDARLDDADLRGADLRGARLAGAFLPGARLADADLRGAIAGPRTTWPSGFDAAAAGVLPG